jgi:outer membrane protein TolC
VTAPRRTSPVVLSVLALASLAGCASYERKPLDLDAVREEFLARTPALPAPSADAAFDVADGLSAAEAEALLLVFNRELRIARLEAGVTRANAENGGLWADPTLGVDFTRIVGSASQGVEAIVSLGLTLPLSGRLELEKARLDAEHAAQLARVAALEWSTVANLRRAWAERAALAAETESARETLGRLAEVRAIVDRMEAAGEVARIESRLFRIEEAKLVARVAELETELSASTRAIESLLDLPHAVDVVLLADLPPRGASAGLPRETVLAGLADANPAVLVARAEHESAERRLEEEIRMQWPDLTLGPGYGKDNGDRKWVLGVGVTLPVFNGNRAGIAAAEAAREVARTRVEAELTRALGDFAAAEERLADASRRRANLEESLLPLVAAQYEETREVARLGEVKTLVLLESLKQELEARAQLIAVRRDEARAAIALDELVGPAPRAAAAEGGNP